MKEADKIKAAILKKAYDAEQKTFVESFGGKDIDAALLLMHELGFIAADDPKFHGTVAAVEKWLRRENLLFRYHAADDFGEPETAFTVCTFWYIDALAAIGRREEGPGPVRAPAGLPAQPCRPPVRGHRPQDRRAVGQFPADLFHGRPDQLRHEAEQDLGGGVLSRLIVVSNRVAPIDEGKASTGGLAVAVLAALKKVGGIWFGWSGEVVGAPQAAPELFQSGKLTYATIDLSQRDYEEYYNGFANSTLWPLFHYRLDLTEFNRRTYAGYLRVNSLFATRLAPLLEPDDMVWVPRLPPDPVRRAAAADGLRPAHGFLPPYAVPGAGDPGLAAQSRGDDPLAVCL